MCIITSGHKCQCTMRVVFCTLPWHEALLECYVYGLCRLEMTTFLSCVYQNVNSMLSQMNQFHYIFSKHIIILYNFIITNIKSKLNTKTIQTGDTKVEISDTYQSQVTLTKATELDVQLPSADYMTVSIISMKEQKCQDYMYCTYMYSKSIMFCLSCSCQNTVM